MLNYDFYKSNREIKTDVSEALRGSWGQSSKATLLYAFLCIILIATPVLLGFFVVWWASIPAGLVAMLLISVLSYGYNYFCHKLALQEPVKTSYIFYGFSNKFMQVVKISIKKFVLGLFWLVLLVVPFVIKSIGYSMATLLLIDNDKINSDNALKESQHLMKQNYMRYFKFLMSFMLWYLLLILSCGIGFVWIAPRIVTSKAIFYENLKTEF